MSDPGRRFVLAVDLGTGGPKVGLVSTCGDIRWSSGVLGRWTNASDRMTSALSSS